MSRVSSPVFVGRAAELDRLSQALEHARSHRSSTRLIAGEAGIGKTRLVREFVSRVHESDSHLLIGDCLPLGDSGLPYAPFVGALRTLLRSVPPDRLDELIGPGRVELAHLLPDLGPTERPRSTRPDASFAATAAQARLFEVVLGMLRRLSDELPVVLVLEDMHWADSSTRDLLRFLVRNSRDARFLFVVTYRSDEMHRRHPLRPLLTELQRIEDVDAIELGAFDAAELAEQLAGITGDHAASELVETVMSRSGGNPFFAEELMAAGRPGLAGFALPRSLRDTLEDRIRRLGDDAQHVIRMASVAGARLDHRLLTSVVSMPDGRLTEAIREAVEHHLLVPTAPDETPGYAFRHALVQEAVYEALLPSERTHLHATYAQAIEGAPDPSHGSSAGRAAQLAHHWLMAHDFERALPAALDAAHAAESAYAFAEAQVFLERALELWPKVSASAVPSDTDRTAILEAAAEAAAQAGDPRRSIDLVRAALAEVDVSGSTMRAGVLQHRLAWYLNESGDWQEGVVAMERAVDLIPIDPPSPERARVLSDLANSLMVRGRFSDSLAVGEAALAISRAVGARVAEARALNAIGLDLACRSDLERGLPILREGHQLATELGDPVAIFLTAVGLGWALDETARHHESLSLARETGERIREMGAGARFGGQLASKAARALHGLGQWDEALALIDERMAAGPTRYAARWLLSNRLRILSARGEVDEAKRDLMTYETLGERVIGPDPDLITAHRAELAIVSREPLVARRLVAEIMASLIEPELDTDARSVLLIGLRAEAEEGDAARSARDPERMASSAQRTAELTDAMRLHVQRVAEVVTRPARTIDADRAWAEALAARASGALNADAWDAAVDGRRALARPYELATALADAAVAYLATRRRDDGAAALAESHVIAMQLRARPLRQRIEAVARRARIGLEGVDTADDEATRLGLTRREHEVLNLLAEGRSNRQIGERLFMAESTAGVHVSNILGKLGVTRRSEAAAVAHRLGLFGVS